MHDLLRPTPDGRMPYFRSLEGVRCWCILLVIYDHLKVNGHGLAWLDGHLGVDLFFLISGFLITTLLAREQTLTGRLDLRAFYRRRIFRLAPVYLVVLALYVAVTQFPSQHEKWVQLKAGLPWFLTLLNEYAHEPNAGNVFTHTWSLGVEEKFYLLWPVLFFVIARTRRARATTLAVLFGSVLIAPLWHQAYLARAYFGLLTGCVLSIALWSRIAPKVAALMAKVPPALVVVVLLTAMVAERRTHNIYLGMGCFSTAAALFLGSLLVRPSWLRTLHTVPLMTWIGRRSYSMYLIHVLCLNAVETRLRITSAGMAVLTFLVVIALTALAAEVLYHAIERPCRDAGRAWLARQHEAPYAI